MDKVFIPLILGTARADRESEKVANFILDLLKKNDSVETELIDVRAWGQSATITDWMDEDKTKDWVVKAEAADGFIIVSPEYNHFFPGELKLFLDQTLKPYNRKPAGLAGVSNGPWGGARGVEHLRAYVTRLGMVAVHPAAYFPKVKEENFDPEFVQPMLAETIWYATALKKVRQNN